MQLKTRTPRDFINALLSKKSIHPAPFAAFKQAVQDFVQAAKNQHASGQTEPNMVTNALKPFIDSLGYNSSPYSQKGQIGIDLVIQQNGKPAVIIEAKRPSSREMMTEQDVNKKAFHEAVYYFMRERDAGNDGLTSVVVTDFDNWFVFDAKDFERLFWDNTAIQKIYQTHKNPNLLSTTTADFYHALEAALPKQFSDLVSRDVIECAHFNLLLAYGDKELAAIYKLLSADCLLKVFNPNDANSLNREFYNELLYILGLEETKQGGKKLINQALTPQAGSLYENTSDKLAQYYKTNDFEAVIKLLIIWINRILFLKLLESQIVTWTDQKNHKFLLPSKIADYVSLENLFFNILAKKIQDRGSNQFDYIPYLNSSLFEVHADELKGITIATLAGDAQMDYYNKTVVKDNLSHKKTGKVNTLAYLFEFLDAYDFANDSKDEVTTDNKSLISASVLGLIFEKINGYKDGSFYTPSFVTMYMAKETIEKTVLQKFNLTKGWECKTLVDLYNKIDDVSEANTIINDIKICDPAVGSGHFLVSALNEILRIKSELGILADENGKRIKECRITIENDELILYNEKENEFFEYKKGDSEKTRIQKTLFKEKQKIIESCLFGVDINPNSVNICRLRLWVELLKNAYYKPDGTLDTLPNIDINIKCGNSLISRFGIKDDLKSRSIQAEIKDYKDKVIQYKQNVGSKRQVAQAIEALKTKFSETLKAGHGSSRGLQDVLGKYVTTYGFDDLSKDLIVKAVGWNFFGKQAALIENAVNTKDKAALVKQVLTLEEQVQEIESGAIYKNAFEWRFEFPEVLNDKGDYIGFDVVIGNPPYGTNIDTYIHYFEDRYPKTVKGFKDVYKLFFNLGLDYITKTNGILAYIAPNTFLLQPRYQDLRCYFLEKKLISILNLGENVFEEATVPTAVILIKNNNKSDYLKYADISNGSKYSGHIASIGFIKIKQSEYLETPGNIFTNNIRTKSENEMPLGEILDIKDAGINYQRVNVGLSDKGNSDLSSRLLYEGKKEKVTHSEYWKGTDINSYYVASSTNRFVRSRIKLNTNERVILNADYFNKFPKLVWRQTASKPIAAIDKKGIWFGRSIQAGIINEKFSKKISYQYLCAVLNSKYIGYLYEKSVQEDGRVFPQVKLAKLKPLPIKIIPLKNQKPFITKVNAIMAAKQKGTDTARLERELDNLIYKLYDLTLDEIKTIDPESTLTTAQYEALG